ncbi:MAG: DUF4398 domain-containing protein [Elusimicrobia bacterium]|nr:DUF4398 domain-containing protein [Elusimicrobiota bacterium]
MLENKSRGLRFMLLGGLVVGVLSGCSKSKEQAVVAMDEARLTLSSAKKAGAESLAYKTLMGAESRLTGAEQRFKEGNYSAANEEATVANQLANQAKSEAETKKASKTAQKKLGKKASR